MNMLVCTPGRLLQHMDETPGFDASQIQILVLDEADRILDMGFSATLNAILHNLPQQRQTMLFSATQTKSVKDLARLSLKAPEYIAVHAEAAMPTPVKLQQVWHKYHMYSGHGSLNERSSQELSTPVKLQQVRHNHHVCSSKPFACAHIQDQYVTACKQSCRSLSIVKLSYVCLKRCLQLYLV